MKLLILLEVIHGVLKIFKIISKSAQTIVAAITKKTSNFAGSMAMIYVGFSIE